MTPTTDRQLILDRSRTAFGFEIDGIAIIEEHGGYALEGEGGFMLLVLSGDREYKVTLGFAPESRGANAIDAINAGYAWLFTNTDAQKVIGYMQADDAATLSTVSLTRGGLIEDTQGDIKIGSITRERWEADA